MRTDEELIRFVTTSNVEAVMSEIHSLRAKIKELRCCHNCAYFNVVFDECEGSPDHCPTGNFEDWEPKGGK